MKRLLDNLFAGMTAAPRRRRRAMLLGMCEAVEARVVLSGASVMIKLDTHVVAGESRHKPSPHDFANQHRQNPGKQQHAAVRPPQRQRDRQVPPATASVPKKPLITIQRRAESTTSPFVNTQVVDNPRPIEETTGSLLNVAADPSQGRTPQSIPIVDALIPSRSLDRPAASALRGSKPKRQLRSDGWLWLVESDIIRHDYGISCGQPDDSQRSGVPT